MHFKRSRHSLYAGPRKEASSVQKQTASSLLYQPPHSCAMQSVKAARPHFLANHRRPAQTNAAQPTGLLPAISSLLPPYITLHRHCVRAASQPPSQDSICVATVLLLHQHLCATLDSRLPQLVRSPIWPSPVRAVSCQRICSCTADSRIACCLLLRERNASCMYT
jgi:hypothetical protein